MDNKSQKEIDDKAIVEQKAVGANNPGGQDKINKNNIGVTAEGKPVYRKGFTYKGC
jgi:hypothetical protein